MSSEYSERVLVVSTFDIAVGESVHLYTGLHLMLVLYVVWTTANGTPKKKQPEAMKNVCMNICEMKG